MNISITEKAHGEITKIFAKTKKSPEGIGLRLGVVEEGCNGLSYRIDFGVQEGGDEALEVNGIKVFIDPNSKIYLDGITLDFKRGLRKRGFVFINPNAANTCGCGRSFSA